jgi:hypothetical protein
MYTSGRYLVQFDPYTKRHYIKNIANRHSDRQWQATQKSIEFVLEHIEQYILTDKAETIQYPTWQLQTNLPTPTKLNH